MQFDQRNIVLYLGIELPPSCFAFVDQIIEMDGVGNQFFCFRLRLYDHIEDVFAAVEIFEIS